MGGIERHGGLQVPRPAAAAVPPAAAQSLAACERPSPRPARPGFYPALDLLCLPSRAEGLPLAPLEAQACGVPVVAARVGGVASALCPDSGRLVPPEDPAALAAALAEALAGPGADPRPFVLRQGSLAAAARAYLDLAFGAAA